MTGIVNISDGRAFNWYAEGKSSFSLVNNLDVTFGSSSSIAIGLKSDFWLGHQASVSIGSNVEASKGPEFILSESSSLSSNEHDDDHYITSYVSSIGGSQVQINAMKKLRTAAFILLGAQTALMISSATVAAIRMEKDNEHADLGHPALGITMTILPQIATLGTAITAAIMVYKKRWGNLKNLGDPACVLSMDAAGGVFLGSMKKTIDTYASGVLVNETGVQLSAAKADLGYATPGDSASRLGFQKDADTQGGARLELTNDGKMRFYGTGIHTTLKDGSDIAKHVVIAQEHHLKVDQLVPSESALVLTDEGALMQRDNSTAMTVQKDSINAIIGGNQGSAMRLTARDSSIGTANSRLTMDANGVHLSFGGTHFQITRTIFDFGGNLTVMNNPAAGQFDGLQQAINDIRTLQTTFTNSGTDAQRRDNNANIVRSATNNMNKTFISARDKPTRLREKFKWPF